MHIEVVVSNNMRLSTKVDAKLVIYYPTLGPLDACLILLEAEPLFGVLLRSSP